MLGLHTSAMKYYCTASSLCSTAPPAFASAMIACGGFRAYVAAKGLNCEQAYDQRCLPYCDSRAAALRDQLCSPFGNERHCEADMCDQPGLQWSLLLASLRSCTVAFARPFARRAEGTPMDRSTEPASAPDICKACHAGSIQYTCVPCGHATLCRKCAMKQATGGKCKTCGSLFGELKRIGAETQGIRSS